MISEHDIAQLCLDIYQGQPAQWDQLEVPPDGVAFGIKEFPEGIALIFRGSATLQDWLRNAEAIADPSAHQGLGPVHPGFFAGLPELWTRLKPRLTQKPCIVAGTLSSLALLRKATSSSQVAVGVWRGAWPIARLLRPIFANGFVDGTIFSWVRMPTLCGRLRRTRCDRHWNPLRPFLPGQQA